MSSNEDKEVLFEIFGTKVKTVSVVYLGLLLLAGWLIVKFFFSVEVPGSWREKGTYETKLYVNVFPDKEKTKNYRLVGDVERYSDCNGDGESTNCYSGYRVSKITFPNEGYIEFDDCEISLTKRESCTDYEGNSYYIELTN